MSHHRVLALILIALGTGGLGAARAQPSRPLTPETWPAIDALGRRLPMPGEVAPPRPGRFVGMFYFLWHEERRRVRGDGPGPFDVARILEAHPGAANRPTSPPWGPMGVYHYWSEPLYGYYLSADPWVIRRHARLLAAAGVDTLIFDATNTLTYPQVYTPICEVFSAIRKAGGRTPSVAFMVNTEPGKTARTLLDELYSPGKFRDLWFVWDGKPLLLCDPEAADAEVRERFTLRKAHWPFELVNTRRAWHWEATYPQVYGYVDDPSKPEQVNVSVAQNLRDTDGQVTNMSSGRARGRSFHDGKRDVSPGALDRGGNFTEQWTRALELDPPFVLVTGWNEWIAGRWGDPDGPLQFVDQFDREYSRDIEPMKGGHADNYYYQLVANIRKYKGMPALEPASPPVTIREDSPFDVWDRLQPSFLDDAGDTVDRDFDGVAGLHYVDRSGRNDIVVAKVARDARDVAFFVRTRQPLTPRTDPAWMWLLIDADRDPATGWQGFDFVVNHATDADGTSWLEKNTGGWSWARVAPVKLKVENDRLQVVISRGNLGLPPGTATTLDFQWLDHVPDPGNPLGAYLGGDAAPEGRFRYRYVAD